MSTKQVMDAQDLIDEGRYDEARKILKKIKTPTARKMLAEIDELSPPASGSSIGRDALHVILIGLIGTLLFSAVGFGIASAIGIQGTGSTSVNQSNGQVALNPTTVPAGQTTSETATPLPSPTPTEVPCLGPDWWRANGAPLQQTVDALLGLSLLTPPADLQAARARFDAWRKIVEVAPANSPCVVPADEALRAALPDIGTAFSRYLTTSTGAERAQSLLDSMDGLLVVADALPDMQLGGVEESLANQIINFTRAECPARRWVTERLLARDYERFFDVFQSIDWNAPGLAQESLLTMRNFSSAFATDNGAQADNDPVPACLRTSRDQFLIALNGFVGYANNRLGGDIGRADQEVQAAQTALANFYAGITNLDPALAGIRLDG